MKKQEFKKLLDDLNIKYEEYEYQSDSCYFDVENATSYLQLENSEGCTLNWAGIYIYFDSDDNFILIEGTE